jgi:hypothetical protein
VQNIGKYSFTLYCLSAMVMNGLFKQHISIPVIPSVSRDLTRYQHEDPSTSFTGVHFAQDDNGRRKRDGGRERVRESLAKGIEPSWTG